MIGHPSVMSCFSISIKHMDCYIYGVTLLLKIVHLYRFTTHRGSKREFTR